MSLEEMRRQVVALGLPWVIEWDRQGLDAVLNRAHALNRMRVDELERQAKASGAQAGDKPRKKDWVTALLRAEFPDQVATTPPGGSPRRTRLGNWLLRSAGALGMAIIVLAMLATPLAAGRLIQIGQAGLRTGRAWATQTAGMLRQSSDGLHSASAALGSSNRALRSVGTSLSDAQPLLTSIGDVLGSQAPDAISTARQSLISAQSGAQSIDRFLRGLSILGFGYNPDQPLAQGLADTADSLAPLPTALSEASDHLATTQDDISHVSRDVVQVSDDLANMSAQIDTMALDLGNEADQLDGLAESMDRSADRLPFWIWIGAGVLEFLLWIGAVNQYAVWLLGRRERQGI